MFRRPALTKLESNHGFQFPELEAFLNFKPQFLDNRFRFYIICIASQCDIIFFFGSLTFVTFVSEPKETLVFFRAISKAYIM